MQKTVAIVQRSLPHYRIDFFQLLYEKAKSENICLKVIYGESDTDDERDRSWAVKVPNKKICIGGRVFYWQPVFKHLAGSELIVVEQANRILTNYWLLCTREILKRKVAFWGHGTTHQEKISSVGNRLKRWLINTPDWWFAYTNGVKEYLTSKKFPGSKITVVQNTVNTEKLVYFANRVTANDVFRKKEVMGIDTNNVALFCGRLYTKKRISFLLDASIIVRKKIQNFNLIIIGDGPDRNMLIDLIADKPWIHYVGSQFDKDKVLFYKIAKVALMPGLVGLTIIDSFSLETPLITTNYPFHSPEIEYLVNGHNGIMSRDDVHDYSEKVILALNDENYLEKLIAGCQESAKKYSITAMVDNYLQGIKTCFGEA